jgi:hypothetical protein
MTALFTRNEQQRMTIARQARRINDLEQQIADLRALLYAPHTLDAAHCRARCEVLLEENRVLRAANRARWELARADGEAADAPSR